MHSVCQLHRSFAAKTAAQDDKALGSVERAQQLEPTRSPLLHSSVCRRRSFMRRLLLSLLVLHFAYSSRSRSSQASLHLRRHDEAEARRRSAGFARRQVGDLQRGRRRSGGQHEDAAHLDRASEEVGKDAHVGTAAPGRPAEQKSAGSSSAERILIADQDADRPRWAPDGKRFAFLSTKEGGSQVWIADFDGAAGTVTEVQQVHVDCDRSQRRTVVARREEHSVHFRCLSRMRR